MSASVEVIQGIKQFSDGSVELMRLIRSVSMGEGGAESPESIMKGLIQTDKALQSAIVKRTRVKWATRKKNEEELTKICFAFSEAKSRGTGSH